MQPELRSEVSGRLETISLNPFENDLNAEASIALAQYEKLLEFAKDPKGLAAQIERDRRAEMMPLEHGSKAQLAFRVLNVLSFGTYVHREEHTDDMEDRLDIARRLQYHTKFLQQIAKSTAEIDITWNLEDVRRSLHFIAEHGSEAGSNAAAATAKIFARTKDDETRRACLDSLSRIHSSKAKNELLRISQNNDVDKALRDLASEYLRGVTPRVPANRRDHHRFTSCSGPTIVMGSGWHSGVTTQRRKDGNSCFISLPCAFASLRLSYCLLPAPHSLKQNALSSSNATDCLTTSSIGS